MHKNCFFNELDFFIMKKYAYFSFCDEVLAIYKGVRNSFLFCYYFSYFAISKYCNVGENGLHKNFML